MRLAPGEYLFESIAAEGEPIPEIQTAGLRAGASYSPLIGVGSMDTYDLSGQLFVVDRTQKPTMVRYGRAGLIELVEVDGTGEILPVHLESRNLTHSAGGDQGTDSHDYEVLVVGPFPEQN